MYIVNTTVLLIFYIIYRVFYNNSEIRNNLARLVNIIIIIFAFANCIIKPLRSALTCVMIGYYLPRTKDCEW